MQQKTALKLFSTFSVTIQNFDVALVDGLYLYIVTQDQHVKVTVLLQQQLPETSYTAFLVTRGMTRMLHVTQISLFPILVYNYNQLKPQGCLLPAGNKAKDHVTGFFKLAYQTIVVNCKFLQRTIRSVLLTASARTSIIRR